MVAVVSTPTTRHHTRLDSLRESEERRFRSTHPRSGATAMLPTADAAWVAGELSRRFGERLWQFTLTATDANRFSIRIARAVTERTKILVFNYCYHGTVDETFIAIVDGEPRLREGSV